LTVFTKKKGGARSARTLTQRRALALDHRGLYNKGNLLVALYVFSCQPCSYSSRKQNYLFSRNFTIPIVGYFQVYACFIVRKELVFKYHLPTSFPINESVLIREFGTRHDAF